MEILPFIPARSSPWVRWCIAAAAVLGATAFSLALDALSIAHPDYLVFVLATAVSGLLAGTRPALVTATMGPVVELLSTRQLAQRLVDGSFSAWSPLLLFILTSLIIVILCNRVRRSAARLQDAVGQIERRSHWVQAVIDSIGDPFMVLDSDWCIRLLNDQARTIYRLGPASIGQSLWAAVPELVGGEFEVTYRTAVEHARPTSLEAWCPRSRRWLEVRAYPFAGGLTLHCEDITARKAAQAKLEHAWEDAQAANHTKDQFLAILSHELRTPLSPALMAARALEKLPGLDQRIRDDLRMICRNIDLEVRLVDDLLDMTRIAHGKLDVSLRPVDVHAAIEQAVSICQGESAARGMEVRLRLGAANHHVNGDPTRLQQIVWNLLRNAVKFTPRGGLVEISTCSSGSGVAIAVRDSGIGIEPDKLQQIFNAFVQGGADIGRRYGGLGLGLAITRGLVQCHHGTITAHSDGPGRGAEFRVELPTVEAPLDVVIPDHPLPPPPPRQLAILLVEDHEDTLRRTAQYLESLEHRVVQADCIAAALAAAEGGQFDLVVSDLGLPDGDGLQLMRQLSRQYGLRGVALSGYGAAEDIQRSRQAGFVEHLVKPVDIELLEAAIERTAPPPLEEALL